MHAKFCMPALVFVFASIASAQTIIYMDYTSGFSTILPSNMVNVAQDSRIYNTNRPGSYSFGVDWNNDASDNFTITPSSPLIQITALNSPAFCATNTTVTLTNTSVHTCNYTVSWTTLFTGNVIVTYGTSFNVSGERTDAISTFLTPSTFPMVLGDPRFVGLRGQDYQVHGIDGAVYNIISAKALQVNSRFVFLTQGQCPIIDGVADTNCWSHPGSYMGELSFQAVVDGKLHAALVTAGTSKEGFASVQMDGKALKVGDTVTFGSFSLTLTSSHKVAVETEEFAFELSNSDLFINQALRSKVALSKLQSHGLLGQTHSSKTHKSTLKFIEGEVDDYVIADNDIYGSAFLFNRFQL